VAFDPRRLRRIATPFVLFAPAHDASDESKAAKPLKCLGFLADSQIICYELTPYPTPLDGVFMF